MFQGNPDPTRSSFGSQPPLLPTPGPFPAVGSAFSGQQGQFGHDGGVGFGRGGTTQPDHGFGHGQQAQHQAPPGQTPQPTGGIGQPPPEHVSDGRPSLGPDPGRAALGQPPSEQSLVGRPSSGVAPESAATDTLPASGRSPEKSGATQQQKRGRTPVRKEGPKGSKPSGQKKPAATATTSTVTPGQSGQEGSFSPRMPYQSPPPPQRLITATEAKTPPPPIVQETPTTEPLVERSGSPGRSSHSRVNRKLISEKHTVSPESSDSEDPPSLGQGSGGGDDDSADADSESEGLTPTDSPLRDNTRPVVDTARRATPREEVPPPKKRSRSTLSGKSRGQAETSKLVTCPQCQHRNAMGMNDPHGICMTCVGRDHDMANCEECLLMSRPRQLERARVLSCWRGLDLETPPPARLIRTWKRDGVHAHLLSRKVVNQLLGTKSKWKHPRHKEHDEESLLEDEDWQEHDDGGLPVDPQEDDFPEVVQEVLPLYEDEPLLPPRVPTKRKPAAAAQGAPPTLEETLSKKIEALLEMQQASQASLNLLMSERAQKHQLPAEVAASTTPRSAVSAPPTVQLTTRPETVSGGGELPSAPGVAASTTPQVAIPPPPVPSPMLVQGETPSERRLRSLGESQQWLGVAMGMTPPVLPPVVEEEGMERLGAGGTPEILQQQMEFPLPRAIRDAWENARQPRRLAEVPMAVKHCYRLSPQDWAYLGATRRPDEALLPYCRGKYKDSSRGPVLIHKDKGLESLDAQWADTIAQSAHAVRPVAMTLTAANQATQLLSAVKQHLTASDAPQRVLDTVDAARQCTLLAVEGAVDAADCLARQNAGALRSLRQSWVEAAQLPENTRKQVLAAGLTGGVPPTDKTKPFSAPLVGEPLTKSLEEAVDCAKQQVLFQQQSEILKPSTSGFKTPKTPAQPKPKVPRQRAASPVMPPASREPKSGSPGYGQQTGQGGQARSQKKPQKSDKKSHKDKHSRGKRDRGRGRGKP